MTKFNLFPFSAFAFLKSQKASFVFSTVIDLASQKGMSIVFKPNNNATHGSGITDAYYCSFQPYSFINRTWIGYCLIVHLSKLIEKPA